MSNQNLSESGILIVDDLPVNVSLLERLLKKEGYSNLLTLTDSRKVVTTVRQWGPDLILLDLMMPHLDGFAVMEQLQSVIPTGAYLPVLVLTADITPEAKQRALANGAKDFLTKPFDAVEVLLRIRNLLQTRFLHLQLQHQTVTLEETVRERTAELRESEARARVLLQAMPDMMFRLDRNGVFVDYKAEKENLYTQVEGTLIGRKNRDISPPEFGNLIEHYIDVTLRTNEMQIFEYELPTPARGLRTYEARMLPSGKDDVTAIVRDITERRMAEERIRRQIEYLTALREIDQAIASAFSMHVSLEVLLSRALKILAVDAVAILLVNSTTNVLEYTVGAGFWTDAIKTAHIRLGEGPIGKAALDRKIVQVPSRYNQTGDPLLTRLRHDEKIIDFHVAPLIAKGKVVGTLGAFQRSDLQRDNEWSGFFHTLADRAVVAIENANLFENLQRSKVELERRVQERTADLQRVNLELERALRAKDEFLANMSHELRTPLNAIIGLSESLEEQTAGPLNEKQQKYVQTINDSGKHLLDLINDILDLAKIESGQLTLDYDHVEVNQICESSLRMIKQLAQMKNQEVLLDMDAQLDGIWADKRRLKQMFVNLLSNAVKFTPDRGRIGLEARGNREANTVMFTVWDTGIGIKEEDFASLFRPFVQLKSELSQKAAGTGLGLALVAEMARLHGGSVSVESQVGKGSRFAITLPWESASSTDSTPRMRINGKLRALRPEDKDKRQTILLVEDTEHVIMVIRDYLELAGYNVEVARTGVEGIAKAKKVHPNLILMDVQMPEMSGLEATQKLRSEAGFEHIPIIALTALAMTGDRERCLAAGMDEYISKPVNLKALVKTIQSILSDNEQNKS